MHPPTHPLQPSSCLATLHPFCLLHHLPLLRPPSLPLPSPCSSSSPFFLLILFLFHLLLTLNFPLFILFLFFFLFFFHFSFFLFPPLPPYSLLFSSSVDLELPLFSSSSCISSPSFFFLTSSLAFLPLSLLSHLYPPRSLSLLSFRFWSSSSSSFPLFLLIIFFFFLLLFISNFLLFLLFPLCHHEQFFPSSSSSPPP